MNQTAAQHQEQQHHNQHCEVLRCAAQSTLTIQHLIVTALVLSVFVLTKSYYNHWRRHFAKCTVYVIGAGPTGITAALIASKSRHVKKLTIFEELDRISLLAKDYQVAFNQKTRDFLSSLGVSFDSMEGVLQDNIFHTRIGVYIEHVLDMLNASPVDITMKYGTKLLIHASCFHGSVTAERQCGPPEAHIIYRPDSRNRTIKERGNGIEENTTRKIERCPGRKVVVAADGSSGQAARLLGLSDEFLNRSCNAYGAVASLEKSQQLAEPRAERRVHSLHFDLSAYGIDTEHDDVEGCASGGFSLKLYGTSRHRHLSLALPISDGQLVRKMRLVLDRSALIIIRPDSQKSDLQREVVGQKKISPRMMRNIFTACYNMCKWSDEAAITDTWAIRQLAFSPRLFDIKLFQRLETVAYFQDSDVFVLAEGEAARCTNFNTGLDINMAMAGLLPLRSVIKKVACSFTDLDITDVMAGCMKHSQSLCKRYIRDGLQQDMLRVS